MTAQQTGSSIFLHNLHCNTQHLPPLRLCGEKKKEQGTTLTLHAYFMENEPFSVDSVAYKQCMSDIVRGNSGMAADSQL